MEKTTAIDRKYLLLQIITFIRVPLAILFVLLVGNDTGLSIILLCGILLLCIEITDLLDGIVARNNGLVSEFGAMLDPWADSTSRLIVYWGLSVSSLIHPVVPLILAVRDISVAYCRIALTQKNQSVAARISGKVKAVIQGVGAPLALFGPLYWSITGTWTISAISWIVGSATLLSAIEYINDARLAVQQKKE